MGLPATPKITWGTGFANTWMFRTATDAPQPLSMPVGQVAEAASGVRDFWQSRRDEQLSFVARLVPKEDTGGITGFATAGTGVREALAWMMAQNVFRFYPDATAGSFHTCYLVADPTVERENGGSHYRVTMKIRDTAGVAFSEY